MDILTLNQVAKSFGEKTVLKELSFSVPKGSIFGFIGQNGAGKTTTMKMILGLLKMDQGEITVCGEKVSFGQNVTNQYIGYLPDVPEFYDFMTPREYLLLCGSITGMSKKMAMERTEELLEMVGLSKERKRIRGFSRGMKQRLGVAQALFNRPKLLICDEPTSALDPVGRKELLEILVQAKEETTILFSTHILSDVERICDQVAFLHEGELVLQGNLEEIKSKRAGNDLEIEFQNRNDLQTFSAKYENGKELGALRLQYENKTEKEMLTMLSYMWEQSICPQKMERLENSLEDLFMEVVGR